MLEYLNFYIMHILLVHLNQYMMSFFFKKSFKCHLSDICLARYEIQGWGDVSITLVSEFPTFVTVPVRHELVLKEIVREWRNIHLVLVILHGTELYNCLDRLSNYFLKCYSSAWHEALDEMKFLLKIEKKEN